MIQPIDRQKLSQVPSYGLTETAHYLGMPVSTIRAWFLGMSYGSVPQRRFAPPLQIADPKRRLLSFVNLVEAHILDALRRRHHFSLQKVRRTIHYLEKELRSSHPLADHRFRTDGVRLFVDHYGELLDVTEPGQGALKGMLEDYLKRVAWDRTGALVRLYPFTRKRQADEPRPIMIDPAISFGRPVLAGTGIPTAVIAERYKAGESVSELAADYGIKPEDVEEAIRCELRDIAA